MTINDPDLIGQFRYAFSVPLSPADQRALGGRYHLIAKLEIIRRSKSKHKVLVQIRNETEYVTWKSLDDVHETIKELTQDMPDGSWEITLENKSRSYDEGSDATLVSQCWRAATADEEKIIADHIQEFTKNFRKQRDDHDARLAAELMARRPDLFPPTFIETP